MAAMSCFDGMYRGWGKHIAANGVAVVMVDFRNCVVASSAPEVAPYPAGLNDCVSGLRWVASHADDLGIDPARIVVAGESGGGNLTLASGLKLRRDGDLDLVKGLYALCPYIAGQWPAPGCPSSIENEGILLHLHNNRGAVGYGIEALPGARSAGMALLRDGGRRARLPTHGHQRQRVRPAAGRGSQLLPAPPGGRRVQPAAARSWGPCTARRSSPSPARRSAATPPGTSPPSPATKRRSDPSRRFRGATLPAVSKPLSHLPRLARLLDPLPVRSRRRGPRGGPFAPLRRPPHGSSSVARAALAPGKINHILVIEFENEGYDATFGPGPPPPTSTARCARRASCCRTTTPSGTTASTTTSRRSPVRRRPRTPRRTAPTTASPSPTWCRARPTPTRLPTRARSTARAASTRPR